MHEAKSKWSSRLSALVSGPAVRPADLKRFLQELANVRDERKSLERLHERFRPFLRHFTALSELGLYRDELRLLWHPTEGIPQAEWEAFEEWKKYRPDAQPGEMICNRWLKRSEVGLLARWEKSRRELMPSVTDLPAVLVYGCLLFANRLFYCANPNCPAPWFIGTRHGQQYCSEVCSAPAKKAAKRKWWAAHRAKNAGMLSPFKGGTRR